jgi:hypothetical protein
MRFGAARAVFGPKIGKNPPKSPKMTEISIAQALKKPKMVKTHKNRPKIAVLDDFGA